MRDIRIGAVVFNAPLGEVDNNVEKMISLIREAKNNNTELICFPEMSITGYCSDDLVCGYAISSNHVVFDRLQLISTELNIIILAGFAQKGDDGKFYASHIVIHPVDKSKIYKKIHIAPPEKRTFTAGNSVPVFHIEGFCFGIQLCYDAHFPAFNTNDGKGGRCNIFPSRISKIDTPREI